MADHPQWCESAYERFWAPQRDPVMTENDIKYIEIPRSRRLYPELALCLCRQEYQDLWGFLETEVSEGSTGGLVLLGQPGIGKSLFLFYAFLKALSQRMPVIFCKSQTAYIHCTQSGCHLLQLTEPPGIDITCETLVLVDSNNDLPTPPGLFIRCPGYVLQATSPQPRRWREWVKERQAQAWVMGLWSKDEIEQLQQLNEDRGFAPWRNKLTYTPSELFDLLGPSARYCFHRIYLQKTRSGNPGVDFKEILAPESLAAHVDALAGAIDGGNISQDTQPSTFHEFFFAEPAFPNPQMKPNFKYHVPTPFLRRVLLEAFLDEFSTELQQLASKFRPFPQVFAAIYEPFVINALQLSKGPLHCCTTDENSNMFSLGPGLSLVRDMLFTNDTALIPKDNHIYIPSEYFPSLDAFVVSENLKRVTMLQMTISEKHGLAESGVKQVVSLFQRLSKGTTIAFPQSWSFIFVTPHEYGEKIAKSNKVQMSLKHINSSLKKHKDLQDLDIKIGWLQIEIDFGLEGTLQRLTEEARGQALMASEASGGPSGSDN